MIFLLLSILNTIHIGQTDGYLIVDAKTGKILDIRNREIVFSKTFPPGSIFKILTAIIALEENIINKDKTFECKGKEILKIDNDTVFVKCWYRKGHGKLNLIKAIAHSCNIYFAKLSLLIEPYLYKKYFEIMKLDEPVSIDVQNEKTGEIKIPDRKKDIVKLAIGEKGFVKLSPAEMLSLVLTVARNGIYIPFWIKSGPGEEENIGIINSAPIIKEGMRLAVLEGTAVYCNFNGLMGGKTGTAGHLKGFRTHGIFAGFYPYDDPEMGIIVFLYKGTGANNAAPLARKILESFLKCYK